MSMNVNIHGVTKMTAKRYNGTTWLHVEAEDSHICVYMPHAAAVAAADAFNAAMSADTLEL